MKKMLLVFSLFFVPFEGESVTVADMAKHEAQHAKLFIQTLKIPIKSAFFLQEKIDTLAGFSQTQWGEKCRFQTFMKEPFPESEKKKWLKYTTIAQQAKLFTQTLKIPLKADLFLKKRIDTLEKLVAMEMSFCRRVVRPPTKKPITQQ